MAPIELDRLRLHGRLQKGPFPTRTRFAKSERFLKGPVPLNWLEAAARLPGKSLHVGVVIWFAAGLSRSRSVSLSNRLGLRFGLDRNAKYRALAWLEGANLIAVRRQLGRAPEVTILDPSTSASDGGM